MVGKQLQKSAWGKGITVSSPRGKLLWRFMAGQKGRKCTASGWCKIEWAETGIYLGQDQKIECAPGEQAQLEHMKPL